MDIHKFNIIQPQRFALLARGRGFVSGISRVQLPSFDYVNNLDLNGIAKRLNIIRDRNVNKIVNETVNIAKQIFWNECILTHLEDRLPWNGRVQGAKSLGRSY